MKKIGITGNIASGKTTVENIIKDNGFNVIDADFICHNALDNDKFIIDKVKKVFSDYDILENNKINRQKLGAVVFFNSELKSKLEKIIHPYVKIEINTFVQNHINDKLVFVSVPLLYEIQMENDFDKVVLVVADENIRLNRLCKRNNLTIQQAQARITAQIPQDEKIKLADFVIYNNSDLKTLEQDTKTVIEKLL